MQSRVYLDQSVTGLEMNMYSLHGEIKYQGQPCTKHGWGKVDEKVSRIITSHSGFWRGVLVLLTDMVGGSEQARECMHVKKDTDRGNFRRVFGSRHPLHFLFRRQLHIVRTTTAPSTLCGGDISLEIAATSSEGPGLYIW